MTDTERDRFEDWATGRWLDVSREPHNKHAYSYVEVDYAWLAWQARAQDSPVCSCPSGDGSLRWPCKVHPPKDSRCGELLAELAKKWDAEAIKFKGAIMRDNTETAYQKGVAAGHGICADELCKAIAATRGSQHDNRP